MGYNFFDRLKVKSITECLPSTGGFKFKRIDQNTIVNEGYASNQDVYAVVSKLATLCADMPIIVKKNGVVVDAKNDEFANFFYNRWNGDAGSQQGLTALYTNLFLFGLAYDYTPIESIGYLPDEQWVLPTQRVEPIVGINGGSFFEKPVKYKFYDTTREKDILPEELVIIRYYDPTNLDSSKDGLSPLQSVWCTVDAENQRGIAEASMMKNNGVAGFLSPEHSKESYGLIGKAAEAARAVAKKLMGGAEKAGTVEVIEQPVKYTPIGSSPSDMKIHDGRMPHLRDICNAYGGVSSMLFNDPSSRTHANYNEAKQSVYTDFVIPQTNLFIDQYTRGFIERVNESANAVYTLEIDMEAITVLQVAEEKTQPNEPSND
jgi:HK97 family phage portal protein